MPALLVVVHVLAIGVQALPVPHQRTFRPFSSVCRIFDLLRFPAAADGARLMS